MNIDVSCQLPFPIQVSALCPVFIVPSPPTMRHHVSQLKNCKLAQLGFTGGSLKRITQGVCTAPFIPLLSFLSELIMKSQQKKRSNELDL